MTTHKQTARHLMVIAAATLALLAGGSIARADGPDRPDRIPQDECDLDRPNCGEDYCERHPSSPRCEEPKCWRYEDECKPVEPKPRPCGPEEYCADPGRE